MFEFSLINKFKILLSIVFDSNFFLFFCMLLISSLIYIIICKKKCEKTNKWVFIFIWFFLLIILFINYSRVVLKIIDKLFDSFFMAIYFPNLTIYAIIIIISNSILIYSINKKSIHFKINIISSLVINVLLVLAVDIVNKNNINIYDESNLYTDQNLLILLQLSTATFISWVLINLLITAKEKLKKYDELDLPKMQEIVFD